MNLDCDLPTKCSDEAEHLVLLHFLVLLGMHKRVLIRSSWTFLGNNTKNSVAFENFIYMMY